MPPQKYTATDPQTGKSVTIEGDSPPTEQELNDIFSQLSSSQPAPKQDPGMWDRLKSAAYQASPLPLFERQNLPTTLGAVAGAATGGAMAIPVAGATAMLTSAAQGGTPSENLTQGLLNAGAEAGAPLLRTAGSKVAPWLMQKAVKPLPSLLEEYRLKAPQLAKFLLDEGVAVTEAGSQKLERLFQATNQEIKDAIATSKGRVYPEAVAQRTEGTFQRVTNQVDPFADRAAVQETTNNFLNHPRFEGQSFPRSPLTVQEAQTLKQGTYQNLKGKYGEMNAAKVESEKALARGLKEDIASEVLKEGTDINAKNAREAMIMAAQEAVDRRLVQSGNANPAGFAMVATHHPATFLAALFDRSPAAKSMVAKGLFESAGRASGVPPSLIRMAVMSLVSSHEAQ